MLDYDYAPASELVEGRRKYFNMSQEGRSDVDLLREEEMLNGLKLSSKNYQPVTCYQISEKVRSSLRSYCLFVSLVVCVSPCVALNLSADERYAARW